MNKIDVKSEFIEQSNCEIRDAYILRPQQSNILYVEFNDDKVAYIQVSKDDEMIVFPANINRYIYTRYSFLDLNFVKKIIRIGKLKIV